MPIPTEICFLDADVVEVDVLGVKAVEKLNEGQARAG